MPEGKSRPGDGDSQPSVHSLLGTIDQMCRIACVAAAVKMVSTKDDHADRWEELRWRGGILESYLGITSSWLGAI